MFDVWFTRTGDVNFSLEVLFYVYVVGVICCIPFRRRLCAVLVWFGYLVLVVCLFGLGCAGFALFGLFGIWICGAGVSFVWGGVSVVLVRTCFWLFCGYV